MDLSDDLLFGVNAIATYLGVSTRRVYYLLETGELPGFKMGGRWHCRKSTVIQRIAELETTSDGRRAPTTAH